MRTLEVIPSKEPCIEPWNSLCKVDDSKAAFTHGRLSFEPPTAQESSCDQYVSDAAKPVPYTEHPSTELDEGYMYGDQSFATGRPDVLTNRTDPLDQDLTVGGPLDVRLQVSSSGTDSDFVVKVIDEDATQGGSPVHQRLVRGEPMRARFRKSFSVPEALRPNEVTAIQYAMPDINHTFLRGHRVVIQVQSSWFLGGSEPADVCPDF